jgi:hypothetical protein
MGSKEIKSENESVGDILRSSMTDLAEQNKEAYDLLLKKASEGFFEQHQTSGALKKLAKQLLDTSETHESENES